MNLETATDSISTIRNEPMNITLLSEDYGFVKFQGARLYHAYGLVRGIEYTMCNPRPRRLSFRQKAHTFSNERTLASEQICKECVKELQSCSREDVRIEVTQRRAIQK